MKRYRVGLVGCGPRQRAHMTAFREVPEVEVVACADIDAERLHNFGEEYGIGLAHRYLSVADMMAAERLDVANVVTAAAVRYQPVRDLALGGVGAILVEKPMSIDLEEADQMLAICEEVGCQLVVNHQYRFLPFALRIKEAVESGSLGTVEYLRTTCQNKLHGQGTHMIDLANFLHGDKGLKWVMGHVSGVSTFDSKLRGPDKDTGVFCYEDDVRLYVECGSQVPRTDSQTRLHLYIEVVGSKGRAWGGIDSGYRIWRAGGEVVEERLSWREDQHVAQAALVRETLAALGQGRPELNRCRGELARRTQEGMIGLLQSAIEHRQVEFPVSVPSGFMESVRNELTKAASAAG